MLGNGERVARLVLAGAMGSVIGFERERLLWAAGLRTHTLQEVTGERASRVRQFVVRPGSDEGSEEVTVAFVRLSCTSVEAIAERLRKNPSVMRVRSEAEM